MANLQDTGTHFSSLSGAIDVRTSAPTNSGVAGIMVGQWYVNSTNKNFYIYNGTSWYGVRMTAA